ncbi:MAG: hypothetical protein L0211_07220, partial [Planctomycetaceae bacterium]|nr:hypothetical protein [Planctomycetaceae bacterium]
SCALSAITAAVVGVVLNLAIWFAVHTLFAEVSEQRIGGPLTLRLLWPHFDSLSLGSLLIGGFALVLVLRWRANMFAVLGLSVAIGMIWFVSGLR